jgi:outer membrane protein assembly factor BamB
MNRSFGFAVAAIVLAGSLIVAAADWPQWRGPSRDGISQETGLLKEWPAGGPKLLWQVKDIGDGFGSPAVVGNWLFVLGSQGMDDEFVQAIDTSDGKQMWKTRIGKVGPNRMANYPGARSTPTVDDTRTYALGSDGDLACLETKSGKIVWQKSLRTDFGGQTGAWAYAESPLIDGDTLVCTPGGSQATMVALRKGSGDVLWRYAAPEGDNASYASVIVVEVGGVRQYVQLLEKGLVGVDAKTGTQLWRYTGIITQPPGIPTPVSRKDLVYGATAKGGGGVVKLKAIGSGIEAAEMFAPSNKLPSAIGGSVEVNGYLYGTLSNSLMCVDFSTGEIKWQERGVGTGSVCYADGMLYVHSETAPGEVALVEATSEGYREKGRFTPPDVPTGYKGKPWAYPIVADGRLYIRDWNCLWCYDVKAR